MVGLYPLLAVLLLQEVSPRIVECPAEIATYVPEVTRAFQLQVEAVPPFTRARRTHDGPDGGIVLETSLSRLHAFDRDGTFRFDIDRTGHVPYVPARCLVVALDGGLLCNRHLHEGTFDVLSPLGKLRETRDFGSSRICLAAETGAYWAIGDETVVLLDSDGTPVFKIRERPDGKPIFQSFGWCSLPDGSLLVAEGYVAPGPSCIGGASGFQPSARSQDPRATICKYSAEGHPEGMWTLPSRAVPTALLPVIGKVALFSPEYGASSFWLLDLESGTLTEPELAEQVSCEKLIGLHATASGDALLCVQRHTYEVFRVSLP